MKNILNVLSSTDQHWVGDGFPVRTLFAYGTLGAQISPFLLLDFAGPAIFQASGASRGVGAHPHRGFETVTIVYEGEVAHRDSVGNSGVIGPGDVQWMTAGRGILHEEFHTPSFARTGGPFRMIQLWVNLPAKDKMAPPAYQALDRAGIPVVQLPCSAGDLRIIAGAFGGVRGAAKTFTPINVWDANLKGGTELTLDLPEGHTAVLVVVSGRISVNNSRSAGEAQVVLLARQERGASVTADGKAQVLVLTGEPIDEPIVGRGPFVMNSESEIRQAMADFKDGRFSQMDAT